MVTCHQIIPIIRIFDEAKAREFYLDFLGFEILFEHRFGDDFPLYLGINVGGLELHLSEHHGDASPGAHIRLRVTNIDGYARELSNKNYRYAKPGAPSETSWGTSELTLHDPFGNKVTFYQSNAAT